jgi:hypothetical protein
MGMACVLPLSHISHLVTHISCCVVYIEWEEWGKLATVVSGAVVKWLKRGGE